MVGTGMDVVGQGLGGCRMHVTFASATPSVKRTTVFEMRNWMLSPHLDYL